MVNERMHALGAEPSAIRELFAYGLARKAEIGEENVFDYIESKAQTKGERVSEASRNFVNDCLNFVKEFVEKEREQ